MKNSILNASKIKPPSNGLVFKKPGIKKRINHFNFFTMKSFTRIFLFLFLLFAYGVSAQTPTHEGFEWEFFPPVGWEASDRWGISPSPHTGEQAAFCTYTNAPDEDLITARMDLTQGINEISFHWRSNALPDNDASFAVVYVSYDAGDSWTALDTLSGTEGSWVEETYVFTDLTSDHAYFKWNYSSNGSFADGARSFALDDVYYPRWYQDEPLFFAYPDDELDFETVNLLESDTRSFTVYNWGLQDLTLTEASFPEEYQDEFQILNELPINIEHMGEVEIVVEFAPLIEGEKSVIMTLTHNADDSPFEMGLLGYAHNPILYPPFLEVFDVFPPMDWTEARGVITEDTQFTSDISSWGGKSFGNQVDGSPSAFVTLALTRNEWLITPTISLEDTLDYELTFDLALTIRNSTDPADLDESKSFMVVISTDNGDTWSESNVLETWDEDSDISNTGQAETVDLTGYSGNIKLAFYGQSEYHSGVMYDIFVDNVRVSAISEDDIEPPMVISLEGNTEVENQDMELLLTVYDESMVSNVTAHYTIEDQDPQTLVMEFVGEGDDNGDDEDKSKDGNFYLFQGTIPAPEGPATGTVYFFMMDEYGNMGNSDEYDLEWYADVEGPEITLVEYPTILGLNREGIVGAQLEDPSGILSATLYYTLEGQDEESAELTEGDDGIYRAEIPAQASYTEASFYVKAIDASTSENETITDSRQVVWLDSFVDEIPVATEGRSQGNPVVAFNGEQYYVVFNDRRLGGSTHAYWGRFVEPDGTVHTDNEINVVPFSWQPFFFPNLEFGGEHFLFTYAQQRSPDDFNRDLFAVVIDQDGQPVGDRFQVSEQLAQNNASFSAVAWDGEKFLAVWQQGQNPREIVGRFISTEGQTIGQPFSIRPDDVPPQADQMVPDIVFTGENFMATWDDNRTGNRNIYGQMIDQDGNFIGNDFAITSESFNQGISKIEKSGNRILVAWEDNRDHIRSSIYGQLIDLKGNLIGEDFPIAVVEDGLSRTWVSLTSNDSEFIASWSHQYRVGITLYYNVHAHRINKMGEIIGDQIVVVSEEGSQTNSQTATDGEDFLVLWQDGRAGYWDTYARMFEGVPDEEAPAAVSLEGNEAVAGHDMHLVLEVSNSSSMESVTGHYTINEETFELTMEAINKGYFLFEGTIDAPDGPAEGTIYFVMTDVNGNEGTSGDYTIEWTEDLDPPVIEMVEAPLEAMAGQDVLIVAKITDASGVASAQLIYSIGEDEYVLEMDAEGDHYSATIPGQPDGTVATYYVQATDASDNQNTGTSEEYTLEWIHMDGDWFGNVNAENITGLGLQDDQPWSLGVAIDLGDLEGRITKIAYIANEGTNPPVNWEVLEMTDAETWTENVLEQGGLLTNDPVEGGNEWNVVEVEESNLLTGNIGLVVELPAGGYWGRDNNAPYEQSFIYLDNTWLKLGEGDLASYPGDWTLKCYIEFEDGTVSVIDFSPGASNIYNYPNPFKEHTYISFFLEDAGQVTLSVYDMQGRRVAELLDQQLETGEHQVRWDAGRSKEGMYFYRLTKPEGSLTGKMLLIRN